MTKAELIASVTDHVKMTKSDVETVLDAFLEVVTEALKQRKEVRLVGFGTFFTRERKETMARNPQTGSPVLVKAAVVPAFKPGGPLKTAVNEAAQAK
jgi:DNA-binding protein HU-beta